jgi:hypothetical protein
MFKYTVSQLARYDKMIPKADYTNLEKFLRTVQDEPLNQLNSAAINTRQGAAQPYEQLFLMIVLANIFVNEYDQDEFTKNDYLKLFSIFSVSIFYEVVCRNKGITSRIGEWRELKPTQIEKYRVYENQ